MPVEVSGSMVGVYRTAFVPRIIESPVCILPITIAFLIGVTLN
jgi:hypothetical protein